MSWDPGTKLGPYEIVAPLGAGGMGEVHRARDTRLNRDVAIKMIPAALAGNEQLRQRFEREAKAISSLNHPNICTLYDIGQAPAEEGPGAGRLHYLVMELLEGESLAERLTRGPLPLHEVLRYGRQIASALEAAHRQGIIHRDLKPGNIILTKTGAKLLDFGLARTAAGDTPPVSGPGSTSSHMPTAMAPDAGPLTAEGTILGTFQYMAPEQLEGSDADPRTDIFTLGAVVYEMAAGKRAFEGRSRTSLIAAIVSSQPAPIASVTPMSPPALDHVVRRCLEKDPDDRWQSAHDVAAELQWIGEAGSQAGVAAPVVVRRKTREGLAWGLAAALGIACLVLGIGVVSRTAPEIRAFRATLAPPPEQALIPFDLLGLAMSPDGRTLAFSAIGGDGSKRLWLRDLSDMTSRALPETEGAEYPFWSPDGRNLGFFADAKLKVIDLRGGSPRALADAPTGRGATWGAGGVILFAPNITSPIMRVPADGGAAEPATRYDPEKETTHRWPVFLPDGKHFVYISRGRGTGHLEVGRLMLAALGSLDASALIDDASNALYVEPGYLLYGRSANLYALRFDTGSLKVEGQPIPLVREKLSFWEPKNFVPFAASSDGTIVYLPEAVRTSRLQWYDRLGQPLESIGPAGYYGGARISPDGRKIVYVQSDSPQALTDIWIRDLDFNRTYRLTQQSGQYFEPSWAPDSDRIALMCQPKGVQDLCLTSLSGGGEVSMLYESSTWKGTGSWLPDGKRLLISQQDPETKFDIMLLPDEGRSQPEPVLRTPFAEDTAQASPDGRHMAYQSDQTGRTEVYIRNLDGSAGQWQVSSEGGQQPRWRADGKELYYVGSDGYMMAAPIQTEPMFRPGSPVRLFQLSERPESVNAIFSDVSADGKRILLNVPTTSRNSIGFHAITHWTALLATEEP